LKVLIASACVAVIAVAGYFFVGEYQKWVVRAEAAEFASFRSECLDRLANLSKGRAGDKEFLTNCIWQGGLADSDLERAKRK
jgi:hypothetical protein